MSIGFRIAIGFYLIAAGSYGFERYMIQGHIDAAIFDAALSFLGVWVLARALDAALSQ